MWGLVSCILVFSSSISLVVIRGLIVSIPSLLILWIRLDHLYLSLVRCLCGVDAGGESCWGYRNDCG